MAAQSEIRQLLLRSQKLAGQHMDAIRENVPLRYAFLHEQLYQYVLVKFLLTDADRPEDNRFDTLVETSLSRSMKISPGLVREFDTAQSCDGTTSAMAKKVLLFMAIQRALDIELPAQESARVKTMADLSAMVWNTLAQKPEWQKKMEGYQSVQHL